MNVKHDMDFGKFRIFRQFLCILIWFCALSIPIVEAATTVVGIKISSTTPTYNAATQTYDSFVTLTNTAKKKTVNGPLAILIKGISRKDTKLANPSGLVKKDNYVFVPLPNGTLAPLQTLSNLVIRFNNPSRKKFTFSSSLITGLDNFKPMPPNHMPVANAGRDLPISVGNKLQLNGSESTDPDGNAISYRWQLTQKPVNSNAVLNDANQPRPTITPDQPGRYQLQLIVNDGQIDSFPDTVNLDTANIAPVAIIETSKKALPGSVLTLDGSTSFDINNDPLRYFWTLPVKPSGSKAKLNPNNVSSPSLKIDKRGDYLARLLVNDGNFPSDPITIKLSTSGSSPNANAGTDQLGQLVNQPVSLSASLSNDTDNQALSYRWSLLYKPSGSNTQLTQTQQVDTQFTPDLIGDYIAQLIVSDGINLSSPDTVLVNVVNAANAPINHAPQITSTANTSATTNQLYQYAVTATDQDFNGQLSFSLLTSPSGMSINTQTGVISWTPNASQIGNFSVTVKVDDGQGGSDSQQFSINVSSQLINIPNLAGITEAQAKTNIINAGFSVGGITYANDDNIANGLVISQTPAASTQIASGSAINLVVSLGKATPQSTLPPDPVKVAPVLDQTIATSVATSTAFLYTGSNPIQTGVSPGTIEAKRAAVIRGKVLDIDNKPLPGVTVSIKDHTEFGKTLSRADGQFDLAVNGGGLLTINYQKTGYLPSQRQVTIPWQDFVVAEDVVMIGLDNRVTTIDLNSAEPIQVAQGNPVTDKDGQRQATLMIPQGTQAQVYNADGSLKPVNNLTLHLTEYTVGTNGPASMPGPLPPTSGYTYAVELTAEESAIKKSGKEVLFNHPVPFYVDNFLNFPAGTAVPAGYYDSQTSTWVPYNNGVVIKILSVTGGLADIDSNGDNTIDNLGQLSAIGITDEERQKLASLYPVNKSLWRVQLDHMSAWDFNWPFGPPSDGTPPNSGTPAANQDNNQPVDPNIGCGSIIVCENQSLGETLGIVGTPYLLSYLSERTAGRKTGQVLDIPLSGATIPSSLKRIELEIEIAGRKITQTFAAAPNQKHQFTWDGLDVYNRKVNGASTADIRIGFVYDGSYQKTERFGYTGKVLITGDKSRTEVTLWQNNTVMLETPLENFDLGAWNIDIHHAYDAKTQTLYLGNGAKRTVRAEQSSVIETVVGGGNPADGLGDGKPAISAAITDARGLAVAPDGTLYIADRGMHRIRKVATDGTISTFAGNGTAGFSGDGGLATAARLNYPEDIALGLDGSLYIADSFNRRVRRVGTDGIITTVAGNGGDRGNGTSIIGDDGLATDATFWSIESIAIGPDGSLYIKDWPTSVRRVGADGIIKKVADVPNNDNGGMTVGPDGSIYLALDIARYSHEVAIKQIHPDGSLTTLVKGSQCQKVLNDPFPACLGDGAIALNAGLTDVHGMAIAADGTVYIADGFDHNRIRAINQSGIINTIAGGGSSENRGEGLLATNSYIGWTANIALAPDGSLFFIDRSHGSRVRHIKKAYPSLSLEETGVPSEDGNELYIFFGSRHLRTINTLTSTIKYKFDYDANGNLSKITDANKNITSIEHNAQGKATAIMTPFGQRTQLTFDTNGYLASVTNPAGEAFNMAYTADGLLTQFKDPRGNVSTMSYDGLGRLLTDQNAAGGKQTLARTELTSGFQVNRSSLLGRTIQYLVEELSTGDEHRRLITPAGIATDTLTKTDGSITTTEADGTIITQQQAPDPRYGMMSPIASSTELKSAGLTATVTNQRVVELTNPNDNLSLKTLIDKQTINGRISKQVYDATSKTRTATSAAGRVSTTQLDNIGRPIQQQITGILALNNSYDSAGHLESLSQGAGADLRKLDLTYNSQGYLAAVIDPLNRQVSFAYDQAGRVTKQTLPSGNVIDYTYDAAGNLTSLTPPGQPAHVFNYTKVNQVGDYVPPVVDTSTNKTVYQYDLDKALTKITRPDGLTLNFAYDNAGRLSKQTVPEGDTNYAYDATTGKLKTITVPDGGKLTYNYNGKLLIQTALTGAVAGSVNYSYDNDFRLNGIQVNGANNIAYSYDADSLLTQAGSLSLTLNPQNGSLTGSTLGVVTDTVSYNGFAETSNYEAKANSTSVLKIDYTLDQLGRITRKVEAFGTASNTYDYSYDNVGRLQEVKRNNTVTSTYSYDANGNRLSRVQGAITTTGSYDAQDRLLSYGNASYTYTGNGELKTKTVGSQVTQYQYDVLSNLRQVSLPDGRVLDYMVDGQNRRIGKKINGTLVQGLLWQDQLQPIAELDGSGNMVSRFVYANHANVPDYMIKGGVTYRLITDHLGSPRLVVNTADGSVMQKLDYDEFGQVTTDTNPGFQPFGFAGGLYDRDTGLVRFGVRDYDSVIGRWVSKDPIGFGGGSFQVYEYSLNNPVSVHDSNGRIAVGIGVGLGLRAIGGRAFGASVGRAISSEVGGLAGRALACVLVMHCSENTDSKPSPPIPLPPGIWPPGVTGGENTDGPTSCPAPTPNPPPSDDGGLGQGKKPWDRKR